MNKVVFGGFETDQLDQFCCIDWITFQACAILSIRNAEKPNMIGEKHGRKD